MLLSAGELSFMSFYQQLFGAFSLPQMMQHEMTTMQRLELLKHANILGKHDGEMFALILSLYSVSLTTTMAFSFSLSPPQASASPPQLTISFFTLCWKRTLGMRSQIYQSCFSTATLWFFKLHCPLCTLLKENGNKNVKISISIMHLTDSHLIPARVPQLQQESNNSQHGGECGTLQSQMKE